MLSLCTLQNGKTDSGFSGMFTNEEHVRLRPDGLDSRLDFRIFCGLCCPPLGSIPDKGESRLILVPYSVIQNLFV